MKKTTRIFVNVLVNVKIRVGKKEAKTIYFVSAVPEAHSSSTIIEAHATSSTTVCTDSESGTSNSSAVIVTVSLNSNIQRKRRKNLVRMF